MDFLVTLCDSEFKVKTLEPWTHDIFCTFFFGCDYRTKGFSYNLKDPWHKIKSPHSIVTKFFFYKEMSSVNGSIVLTVRVTCCCRHLWNENYQKSSVFALLSCKKCLRLDIFFSVRLISNVGLLIQIYFDVVTGPFGLKS